MQILMVLLPCLALSAWLFWRWQRAVQAQIELVARCARLESEKSALVEATAQAQDAFRNVSVAALEGNAKQFLEMAKMQLAQESQAAKGDLEKREAAIHSMVKPLQDQLKQCQDMVSSIEKDRQRAFGQVEAELRRVIDSNLLLATQTSALKDALKKPNVRGRWGEMQLKNCIELAGMSEYCDITFQDLRTDEAGDRLIPDMTVRMPGGRMLVVDAKTPIEAFIASLEAQTDESRAAELTRHGRQVKDHVKKLATKAYHSQFTDSPDFTVMFLPNESFLYAALESQSDLVEFALQKKILICTPPTLIGLLKVIRFCWTEERVAKNARQIQEAGEKLHKRLVDFWESFEKIGTHLDRARNEYEAGVRRFQNQVLPHARKFEEIGVSAEILPGALPGSIEPVNNQ